MSQNPHELPEGWVRQGGKLYTACEVLPGSGSARGDLALVVDSAGALSLKRYTGEVSSTKIILYGATGNALFQGNVDVDGALDVGGVSTLTGAVNIDGAVDLDSTLDVLGTALFQGAVNIDGAVDIDSTIDVLGTALFQGAVNIDGAVDLDSTLDVLSTSVFRAAVDMDAGLNMGTASGAGVGQIKASGSIAGVQPAARITHNIDQSIDNDKATAVAFNTEQFDTDNLYSGAATDRLTIQTAGIYRFRGMVEFVANATGYRYAILELNGTTRLTIDVSAGISGIAVSLNPETIWSCAANDYVRLLVYQNSGAGLNVQRTQYSSPVLEAFFIGTT